MKEGNFKIHEILEVSNDKHDGYSIILRKKEEIKKVEILIDNYQDCCEDWGFISSEDNFDNFIGSDVIEIYTTGIEGETSIKDFINAKRLEDENAIMFLTFKTSNGTLQFAVYNDHNGYYGHQAIIRINDEIIESEIL